LTAEEADAAYTDLHVNTKWEKTAKINRWVSLVTAAAATATDDDDTEAATAYKYRDAPGASIVGFNDTILLIKKRAEEWYSKNSSRQDDHNIVFNVCLLNFYEDGDQRIGWHSDREEVGRDTPIASVSLGATRAFMVRSKERGVSDRITLDLEHGSLCVMENKCQLDYLHSIPKQKNVTEGRINLTFRCKSDTERTAGEDEHERRDKWLENIIDGVPAASSNMGAWSSTTTEAILSTSKGNDTTSTPVFGDGVRMNIVHDNETIQFLVKTNLGAEGYCAAEIQELLPTNSNHATVIARPLGMDGFVAICGESVGNTVSTLLQLKSAHHLLTYHDHFDLSEVVNDEFPEPHLVDGETLYAFFKKRLEDGDASVGSLQDLNKEGGSFRVTCDRIGNPHGFRAPEVERYENTRKLCDYDIFLI
jgi:hypothetical protein